MFRSVDIGLHYVISVSANSTGGTSIPTILHRQISHDNHSSKQQILIIVMTLLVTIVVLIAVVTGVYIFYKHSKQRRFQKRCKYFEVSISNSNKM